ncbi:hypothetical protein F2P45_09095 [Massilia sp. CCM 8733]|uniref:Uncharacterized protein n=1 Tax=Massilia mucilaginosa TaxID=2609282 RepID=A0ABX0NQW2_9BURK|nr:hypothetical protein [Massilia mucilaginosa]
MPARRATPHAASAAPARPADSRRRPGTAATRPASAPARGGAPRPRPAGASRTTARARQGGR